MASDWKLLHHQSTSEASIPSLLVKYEFGTSSYKIWITDLTYVWGETLDQRPLVQRAWDIETDIDPIESDQRQMLLQKIKDSLNEVPGTKLALSRNEDLNGIQLTAFSPLPKPFKALQWPFYLAVSPNSSLTNELVLPLLGEQLRLRKKLDSLLDFLSEKDHVINKLTDKLQSDGIELGKVFPGAISSKSSHKSISKEELGKSVKGLGSFDEAQWQRQCTDDLDIPGNCQGLFSQLLAHNSRLGSSRVEEQLTASAWWEQLSADRPLADDGNEDFLQAQSQSFTANDFQRQVTPELLVRHAASGRTSSAHMTLPQRGINPESRAQGTVDDGSTTETSDEDLDAFRPEASKRQQSLKPAIEKSSSSRSSSPEPAHNARQDPSPKPKGMLGRIGGAPKPTISPNEPKLGQIRGTNKSGKSPMPASKSPEPRSRLVKQPGSPPSPRETSQERANKKREQLKRELEEKSKLGVKKKRKF